MLTLRARTRATLSQITPQVWRILAHSFLFGLALSIADLLFNFYLASLGYAADVAGLLSTVNRVAGVASGLPMGILIDRWGPRRSLLLGVFVFAASWVLLLAIRALWVLALGQFLIGASYILAVTAVTPLLSGVTRPAQRASIFGLNAAAALVVGLLGSSLGGLLPGLAGWLTGSAPQSALAYQIALTSVIVLALIASLPILLLAGVRRSVEQPVEPEAVSDEAPLPMMQIVRFSLPYLLMGLGGGFILPFQNLFFRQSFDLNDAAVGAVIAWSALAMGVGALIGAPISARLVGERAVVLLRFATGPVMLLMLIPALVPAAAGMYLRGLFIAASFPLNDSLVMQTVPARQRGISVSLMSAMWSLGWAAASAFAGWAQLRWGFAPLIVAAAASYALSALIIPLSLRVKTAAPVVSA